MLAALWLLGTEETYRSVADRFGFNKGRLHHTVLDICHALVDLRGEYIQWPQHSELAGMAEKWMEKAGTI